MIDWFFTMIEVSLAKMVFLSIFGAGMVFTLGSLILGGDHGGDTDGHDFHLGDHDTDTDTDHDTDGHEGGPSLGLLSIRGISLMMAGFGGVAFIAYEITKKVLFSSICGVVFGLAFAVLLLWVLKHLKQQGSNSLVAGESVVGTIGVVTTAIPGTAFGEVRLNASGVSRVLTATSEKGVDIPNGSQVKVTRYVGGNIAVEQL